MSSTSGCFWDIWNYGLKKPIHDALSGADEAVASSFLRDPANSTFFWGFDAIARCPDGQTEPHELVLTRLCRSTDWKELYAYWVCDCLLSLAEALGARTAYPEIDVDGTLHSHTQTFDADSVLDQIEAELSIKLTFPNPYPSELGIPSRRGIIGFRSVQSLYQAWRISQIASGNPEFKVLEIGAGLGRTAYFAHLLGVRNYTIVDIPMTNAAQGYFLGRSLGPNNVILGKEEGGHGARIISTPQFEGHAEKYDLIVNVDSWTEMPKEVAKSYWEFSRRATNTILSINHEFNAHTVRELYRNDAAAKVARYPYPMRRGYVEETITWRQAT